MYLTDTTKKYREGILPTQRRNIGKMRALFSQNSMLLFYLQFRGAETVLKVGAGHIYSIKRRARGREISHGGAVSLPRGVQRPSPWKLFRILHLQTSGKRHSWHSAFLDFQRSEWILLSFFPVRPRKYHLFPGHR